MYIDTHAHLYLEQFDDDIAMVIELCKEDNVDRVYLPNVDSTTTDALLELSDAYPEIMFPMMGVHPCSIKEDYKEELKKAEEWLKKRSFCAIGEIGIDLYWDKTFHKEQILAFETQIEWAREMNIPFVIHSRDSLDETIATVAKLQKGDLRGIFHCFNGTVDQGKAIQDIGFFIGIGGVITFKNAGVRENVAQLPLEMMVLETDAPYLAPVPFRGKRNQSNYIPIIAEQLAVSLEVELNKVARITTENAKLLFDTPISV